MSLLVPPRAGGSGASYCHGREIRFFDVVHYTLPFGILGQLMRAWFVKADLDQIFDYRAKKVAELLRKAHIDA